MENPLMVFIFTILIASLSSRVVGGQNDFIYSSMNQGCA